MCLLDQDQRTRLEFGAALRQHGREMAPDGFGAFVGEPKQDDVGLSRTPSARISPKSRSNVRTTRESARARPTSSMPGERSRPNARTWTALCPSSLKNP